MSNRDINRVALGSFSADYSPKCVIFFSVLSLYSLGATSAPSLIFILPGTFYIRIVPQEQEPLLSRPKIQVPPNSSGWACIYLSDNVLVNLCHFTHPPPGHMLRCSGLHLHGHEFGVHHHWLGNWRVRKRRWALKNHPADRKRSRQNANQRSPLYQTTPDLPKPGCTKRGMCRERAKE